MFSVRLVIFAALTVPLLACASDPAMQSIPQQIAGLRQPPALAAPPLITGLASMHDELPGYKLATINAEFWGREVSVERDLGFTRDSTIMSNADVERIAPLQAYLRANPSVGVRVEGYGDGAAHTNTFDLALSRAQAVVRALLTDMRIQNAISAVAAPAPHLADRVGRAEVIFIGAHSFDLLQAPQPDVVFPPGSQ